MPEVSVLITTYNGARFIRQALESLVRQDFRNFELIVVDDGSSDDTVDIVQNYKDKFPTQLHVLQKNFGISHALRVGIDAARTDFIVVFDQDDVCAKSRLGRFKEEFCRGSSLVSSAYEVIDELGNRNGHCVRLPSFLSTSNLYEELLKRNYFLGSATGFDRSKFEYATLLHGAAMASDYAIALELARRKVNYSVIQDPLLAYRLHSHNTSKQTEYRDMDARRVLRRHLPAKIDLNSLVGMTDTFLLSLGIAYQFLGAISDSEQIFSSLESRTLGRGFADHRLEAERMFYSANLNYQNRHFEAARSCLDSYIQVATEDAVILNNMGVLNMKSGDIECAKRLFGRALEMMPEYRDAAYNWGSILSGRYENLKYTARHQRTVLL